MKFKWWFIPIALGAIYIICRITGGIWVKRLCGLPGDPLQLTSADSRHIGLTATKDFIGTVFAILK